MDVLREFLESSTIHGLTDIASSKSRLGKCLWGLVVVLGFCTAGYLINGSYVDWRNSPISTSISTVPIEDLPFPKVTVCPRKGSNTALNPDLMRIREKGLTEIARTVLMNLTKDQFLEGPYMAFVNTTKELVDHNNLKQVYMGFKKLNFPSDGNYSTESAAMNGIVRAAWSGQKLDN